MFYHGLVNFENYLSVVMSVGVDSVTYIDTRRLDNPLVQPLGKFIRSAELNSSKKLLTTDNRYWDLFSVNTQTFM